MSSSERMSMPSMSPHNPVTITIAIAGIAVTGFLTLPIRELRAHPGTTLEPRQTNTTD
jgi:hypothetical protein